MNHILQSKLRSQSGASMILALIFLLFCTFVGSTVLVSATANAYRVKHLSDQQAQLTERSTALLLTDELQLNDIVQTVGGETVKVKERLQMNVVDSLHLIEEVSVGNGGVVTPTGRTLQQRIVTFRVFTTDAYINPAQRLMLEATVQRYLCEYAEYAPGSSVKQPIDDVRLEAFPAGGPSAIVLTSPTEFWFQPPIVAGAYDITGTITVEGSSTAFDPAAGTGQLPTYTVHFSSGRQDNLYDFYMDFGEFSQLKVTMNAFYGLTEPNVVVKPPRNDPNTFEGGTEITQISTTMIQTIISWDDPLIEKGGNT